MKTKFAMQEDYQRSIEKAKMTKLTPELKREIIKLMRKRSPVFLAKLKERLSKRNETFYK